MFTKKYKSKSTWLYGARYMVTGKHSRRLDSLFYHYINKNTGTAVGNNIGKRY
jgi:hypothetical protein